MTYVNIDKLQLYFNIYKYKRKLFKKNIKYIYKK